MRFRRPLLGASRSMLLWHARTRDQWFKPKHLHRKVCAFDDVESGQRFTELQESFVMRKHALQLRICSWCCGCERCGGKRRGSILSRMECQCEIYTSKDHLFGYTLCSPCYSICSVICPSCKALANTAQFDSSKVIPLPCNFSALIIQCVWIVPKSTIKKLKEINNSRQVARISFLMVSELTASMLVPAVMKSPSNILF